MIGPPKPIRCAIYTRKSTSKGLDAEFTTLDAQREAGEAFVTSQRANGWSVIDERYDDGGFSGGTTDRPALRRLLADIEGGKIDAVVVYKADRLSRSLLDFARLLADLEKHEVAFVSVTEQFSTATPAGRLMLNMIASFAEYERALIAERTSDKIRAARRKGRWTGGIPMLGYDIAPEGGRLLVNEAEALRVQAIFSLYLEVGSLKLAAEEMARRGWERKRWTNRSGTESGGGPFAKTSLHHLLTNPVYVGRIRCNGDTVAGEHDAIVDVAVFEEVRRRLRANGHKRASARRARDSQSWLRGLIRCGACDAPMSPSFSTKGNRRYRYYVCREAQRLGWSSCTVKSVAAGDVEAAVLTEVRASIQGDAALLQATVAEVHRQRKDHVAELKREIRIVELERESANGNAAEVTRRLTKLTTELAALSADRIPDADVANAVEDFAPLWDALTYREQAEVAGLIIERVVYDGDSVEITFRDSEVVRGR